MERLHSQEFFDSLPPHAKATWNGLLAAFENHQSLGPSGYKTVASNQFGEMALQADIQAEKRVLETMRDWTTEDEVGTTIKYRGEELGSGVLGEGGENWFLRIDGLDGTANYKNRENADWPYGTMIALARSENPTYNDFVVAGITLHEEEWIVLGIEGRGVFIIDLANNREVIQLPTFSETDYDHKLIMADDFYNEAKEFVGERNREIWPRTGSAAASYVAMVLQGQIKDPKFEKMNRGWQALVDVTRKGNLELPVGFLFLRLLGGTVVDKEGNSIGSRNFETWGQDSHEPVIMAVGEKVILGLKNYI